MWEGEGVVGQKETLKFMKQGFISCWETSMVTLISGVPQTHRQDSTWEEKQHHVSSGAWLGPEAPACTVTATWLCPGQTSLLGLTRPFWKVSNWEKFSPAEPFTCPYVICCLPRERYPAWERLWAIQHLTASRCLWFITRSTPGCRHSHMTLQMMLSNRNLRFFLICTWHWAHCKPFLYPKLKKRKKDWSPNHSTMINTQIFLRRFENPNLHLSVVAWVLPSAVD